MGFWKELQDGITGTIKEIFPEEDTIFRFSPRLTDFVGELAQKAGVEKPDILRRALALYSYVDEMAREGRKLAVISQDEKIEEVLDLS